MVLFYVRFLQLISESVCNEEDCFYVVLFIVLAILMHQSSGCAHSFPPLNKVGFSVIYFYGLILGNQQGKCPWFKRMITILLL